MKLKPIGSMCMVYLPTTLPFQKTQPNGGKYTITMGSYLNDWRHQATKATLQMGGNNAKFVEWLSLVGIRTNLERW